MGSSNILKTPAETLLFLCICLGKSIYIGDRGKTASRILEYYPNVWLIGVEKKYSFNLMRNVEVYEEVRLKSLRSLNLNTYKK